MTDKKLLRKIAPIIMSVAVAMTSSPVGVMAEDFTSGEVAVEISAETADSSDELAGDYEEADETAYFGTEAEDGFESGEVAGDESEFEDGETGETEDAFTADAEGEATSETGDVKKVEDGQIVLMNIPYEAFYRSELKNNDVKVDAFTSATKNKSRTKGMMNGNAAYHTDAAGTNLAGITFPVKVTDASVLNNNADKYKQITDSTSVTISVTNRGQTSQNTYTGKDALIEAADYAYYVPAADAAPTYYKELTVDADGNLTFGSIQGMTTQNVTIDSTFKTNTTYGDYELDLNDETFANYITLQSDDPSAALDSVYGAVINTTDGTTYALRHLENIWRGGHLAWGVGLTTKVHDCPVSSEHYKSMVGKTISSVTYYTSKGIINFDIEDTKVLAKTDVTATAENIKVTDTEVKVSLSADLPADYAKKYSVDGTEAEATEAGVKVANLTPGTHTVTVSDANEVYAPISTTFVATTDTVMAAYDEYDGKLVAAADITAEQFAAYTKGVSKVKIGEKEYAASGRGAVQVVKEDGTLDYSKAEVKDGDKVVVSATGYPDFGFTYNENVYVYAGLTWAEYWASEDVYNAGSTASSDEKDRKGETDLGAFDAVSRATANHGLHRGSFQAIAVLNGKTVSYWSKDGKTVYYTDGTSEVFNRNNVKGYTVTGLKYVPIQIKRTDLAAFAETHAIVKNGGQLIGGYGEQQLKSYDVVANVTANTNGLKKVTKDENGSFVIGARQTGSESGIKDVDLKVATGITTTVKDANGSYGEFLRVDLTGDYGDLGSHMQSVEWAYYGNDSTYTNRLANYGTKFAADNWMHKSMGIQLGLTESGRCKLPEGYDGTGYWMLTVHALGYQDYVVKVLATDKNIVKAAGDADSAPLEAIIAEAKALKEADYTPESWAAAKDKIANELEECEEMLANIKNQTSNGVTEQIGHLREALDMLVKAPTPTATPVPAEPTATPAPAEPTATPAPTETPAPVKGITATAKSSTIYTKGKTSTTITVVKTDVTGKVKFTSSNKKVATVTSKGVVKAKKAGKATITVKVGNYTKKVVIQVKKPSLKLAKSSATIKKGKTVTIKATATPSGKVTYKSSNKKVATVTAKGVVKGKKKGTATITVTSNGVSKKFKVKVK